MTPLRAVGQLGERLRRRALGAAWVCLVALVVSGNVPGATYYISADGSDTSDGSAADPSGQSGPWKTLANVARTALRQGDRILLRCGDRFAGPLSVEIGRGGGEFRLGGYGTCAPGNLPVVDGARPVAAALSRADRTLQTAPVDGEVAQVFWNDQAVPVARYPLGAYLVAGSRAGNLRAEIPLAGLPSADLLGAGFTARTHAWFIEERRIASVSGVNGVLDRQLDYPLDPGSGYFFTGKPWMIGSAPAWGVDRKSRTLVVRPPAGAAQGGQLAVSAAAPLVRIAAAGAVAVDGVVLDRAGGIALDIATPGAVDIDGVVVRRAALGGIRIKGASTVRVERSEIRSVGGDGISVESNRTAIIRSNVLADIASGPMPRPVLAAINAWWAAGAWIANNTIIGSGYIGIRFRDGATIEGNIIENACMTLADCGAIYSWRNDPSDQQLPSLVAGNAIVSAKGDQEIKPGWRSYVAGIYLDDHVANVQVRGNVVVGARQGLYLHNAAASTLQGNVVLFSGDVSLAVAVDSAKYPSGKPLDNALRGNALLFARGEGAVLMIHRTFNRPLRAFADNVVTGTQDPPPVVQYWNESTPGNPRYRHARVPVSALAADGEANVTEPLPAALAPRGTEPTWRVDRNERGITLAETGGRVLVMQGNSVGQNPELPAGKSCLVFRGGDAADSGSIWPVVLCREDR
jgi:parallel beta-helix repeat protein